MVVGGKSLRAFAVFSLMTYTVACGGDKNPASPTARPLPNPVLSAPAPQTPSDGDQLDTLRPTLTVTNGTSDQTGARTYEFQIADNENFSTNIGSFITAYAVVVEKTGVAEGTGTTSFTLEEDLQPTTRFYWRSRMRQGSTLSEWSPTKTFKSRLMGFVRAGELYDPLIHGETVGQIVGSASFIPGKGIQLHTTQSHVKYLLPQTITNGEFSMDVEGLRANAPGNKSKVFGMQEGQGDFITNKYRVDVQYRGTEGSPPNAIQWRVLYGSSDDLDVRYEPDLTKRYASVFLLNPSTTYHWKATWGTEFRVIVRDGGIAGSEMYNYGLPTPRGTYSPNPHYVYLGTPVGRSGTESATIPGTIYRNVWIGNRPRPDSLGSALR
jgi:hypothetical protein